MGKELGDDPVYLIRQIARGDRDAFGQFYDRYASLVFTFAMRLLRERFDAEDLLQEVFVRVWREAGSYNQDRGSPEAWIITITRSRAIDKLRSRRRRERGFVAVEDPAYSGKGEIEAVQSEARLIVNSALARLPEAQRKVLELAYLDGLTQSEIAARLGEPLGTIKTRMRSGIERLREFLGGKARGEIS
ncbi:MAG: sigma-70 family RNA polymerase sigma factor [Candidatus Binatia bacterium]